MLQLTESETTLPAIQLLAAAGADINVVTAQGYTPLIIASAHGWADIVAWFIENVRFSKFLDFSSKSI